MSELSENVNIDPVYCKQLVEPVMQWMMIVFRSFMIERKINNDSLDWAAFQAHVLSIKTALHEKLPNNSPQAGAILFALDRMPHCMTMLIQNWNDIQTE